MYRRPRPIIENDRRILLRAALGEGESAADAYRQWRKRVSLDDIDVAAYRVMPLLLQTVEKNGLGERDERRMRGVAKHIWLSNLLRMRSLASALTALGRANVESLLLKGAALFARDDELSAVRVTEDYDLLVRRCDAERAIIALIAAGFRSDFGVQANQFVEADFESIHAIHFVKESDKAGNLDIHWRPLPRLNDAAYVDEMFVHADHARLAGHDVRIASLTDHLFLTVSRSEPWEVNETFLRAVEAIQVIRVSKGKLDWRRFERLAERYGYGFAAASMLHLIEVEANVAIPKGVIQRLWGRQATLNSLELSLRRIPPYRRGAVSQLTLQAIQLAKVKSTRNSFLAVIAVLARTGSGASLLRGIWKQAGLGKIDLQSLWLNQAVSLASRNGVSFAHGFSFPEAEGRWTDGQLAILEVPADAVIGTVVQVRLLLRPFFPPGAVEFRFNSATGTGSIRRHVLTVAGGSPVEVVVDARVVGEKSRKVVIVLRLLDAGRPIAYGLSDDMRLLGLLIERVVVHGETSTARNAGHR